MIRNLSGLSRSCIEVKKTVVSTPKASFFGLGKKSSNSEEVLDNPNLARLPEDISKPIFTVKSDKKAESLQSDLEKAINRRDTLRKTEAEQKLSSKPHQHVVRTEIETVQLSSDSALKAALRANSEVVRAKRDGLPIEQVDDDERIREEREISEKNRASIDAVADRLIEEKITKKFQFADSTIAKATGISQYVQARKEHAAHIAKSNPSSAILPEMIAEFSSSHASHNMRQPRLTIAKYAKYFMPSWDPLIQRSRDSASVQEILKSNNLEVNSTATEEKKSMFSGLSSMFSSSKLPRNPPTLADLDLIGDSLSGSRVNLREAMCVPNTITVTITYNSEAAFDISRTAFLEMMERYHNRLFQVPGYPHPLTVNTRLLIPTSHFLKKFMSKEKIVSQMAARYPESSEYHKSILLFFLENDDEPFYRWKLAANALNRFTSYIFITDSSGKIRWSGAMSENPTSEEFALVNDMVQLLISESAIESSSDKDQSSNRRKNQKK